MSRGPRAGLWRAAVPVPRGASAPALPGRTSGRGTRARHRERGNPPRDLPVPGTAPGLRGAGSASCPGLAARSRGRAEPRLSRWALPRARPSLGTRCPGTQLGEMLRGAGLASWQGSWLAWCPLLALVWQITPLPRTY